MWQFLIANGRVASLDITSDVKRRREKRGNGINFEIFMKNVVKTKKQGNHKIVNIEKFKKSQNSIFARISKIDGWKDLENYKLQKP